MQTKTIHRVHSNVLQQESEAPDSEAPPDHMERQNKKKQVQGCQESVQRRAPDRGRRDQIVGSRSHWVAAVPNSGPTKMVVQEREREVPNKLDTTEALTEALQDGSPPTVTFGDKTTVISSCEPSACLALYLEHVQKITL